MYVHAIIKEHTQTHTHTHIDMRHVYIYACLYTHTRTVHEHTYTCTNRSKLYARMHVRPLSIRLLACIWHVTTRFEFAGMATYVHAYRYIHIHPPARPPTHPRMHARLHASSCVYIFSGLYQTGHVTNACIATLHVDRRFPMSACMEDRRNCGNTQRVRFMNARMDTCRRTNLDRYAGR